MRLLLLLTSVCLLGCASTQIPNSSATLWEIPNSRIAAISSSDTINRMAAGTAPVVLNQTQPDQTNNSSQLQMTAENPINRYQPLVDHLVENKEENEVPQFAEELQIEEPELQPDVITSTKAKQLSPEPAPLMLDLETALRMAGGTSEAGSGRLLDAAIHYLDMLEAIQNTRILEEARTNATAIAAISAKLSKPADEHAADAGRLETKQLLLENQTHRWQNKIAKAKLHLRKAIGVGTDREILPVDMMTTPICIVSPDQAPADLLSVAMANRAEFADANPLILAACRDCQNRGLVKPSVLLQRVTRLAKTRKSANKEESQLASEVQFATPEFETEQLPPLFDTVERIALDVDKSHSEIVSTTGRIDILQQAIASAETTFVRSLRRLEAGKCGLFEAQQTLEDLSESRLAYLEAVVDHNRAQFYLQQALGWPNTINTPLQPEVPTGFQE